MVAIDQCIVVRVGKTNRWLPALIIFPLLMAILPVKSPWILTIIARGAPLVLVVVTGHGGCCPIFGIWDNRLISHRLWKLICGILGLFHTKANPPLTCSISGYGPFKNGCVKLYLTWQMNLFQSHYHFHYGSSWNQLASKPCWLNVKWPQCMPLEVKFGLETFLCW